MIAVVNGTHESASSAEYSLRIFLTDRAMILCSPISCAMKRIVISSGWRKGVGNGEGEVRWQQLALTRERQQGRIRFLWIVYGVLEPDELPRNDFDALDVA